MTRLLTAALLWLTTLTLAQAHEINPAIADVQVDGQAVSLDITLSLEPLIAGIDLGRFTDTNAAPEAEEYDRLRALTPQALDGAFEDAWPRIREGFVIVVDGTRLVPVIERLDIVPNPNIEQARESQLRLSAALPDGDAPVQVGWSATFGPIVVRQSGEGDDLYAGFLDVGALSSPLPRQGVAERTSLEAFVEFVSVGFDHIIPRGLDHILFVLGLFFFSVHLRPLVVQVTAFTLAHTITLALATLGVVSVPASVVELLIAASIVYVAVENIFLREMKPWRLPLIFAFGLLHGLGFASVLADWGLSSGSFVASLVGFNIGVEIGQLAVILAAYLTVGLWFGKKTWYHTAIATPASIVIAAFGAFWVVERTLL